MKDESANTIVPPKEGKVTPSILDAFGLLKSPKEDQKIVGATKIISILQGNENEKEKQYALKRLVRSVGANHPDIRTGYYSTLTNMLSQFDISLEQVLGLVKTELHANGSSKSEVGDVALGQILICGAVFRSGLMLKSSSEEQAEVVKLLFTASTKKSYLNIVAYQILIDFVNTLTEDQFTSIVWSNIKKDFKKDLSDHNLDTLYFLMVVSKKYPKIVKIKKLLGAEAVICDDTLHTLTEKLLSGIDFNSINHPIYKEIGLAVANSPHLQVFWTSGIDSQLAKHNRNRELVVSNMLITILNNMEGNYELLPELLSKNFFKLFMDWFKGLQTASKIRNKRDDEEDNKIMIKKEREVLNALAKVLKSEKVENKVRVETLKKLLFHPGHMNFSEITGTTIIKSIISDLNAKGVHTIAKLFIGVLLNTSKKIVKDGVERNWYNSERLKAAEGISYLVIHDAVKDDIEFKVNYMKKLMCVMLKLGGDEAVSISNELSGTIKACFYRCFSSRFSSVDHMVEVLSSLSLFINTTLQENETEEITQKHFQKESKECWELLYPICQSIEKNKNKSKIDKVFLILLYQLGLFLFSEPKHVEMATGSIKELKSCYEHYKKGKKNNLKNVKEGDIVEDEPEWIEVLVEVLLSILSTDSSVLRSVVQCVYRLLYEYLTPSAIGQILSVLDPESENNPLEGSDDESGDDSEASDKDDDNDDEDKDKEEAEEDEDDSDDEIEEDDVEMKTPDQLRMAIQKALGGAVSVESDAESIDADMIDEEEGKKLDEALAEAFKQFHGGKNMKTKKQRKDKKTLCDFRIRVLDLLDIYLEKDPSMDVTLSMMEPLIRCLEFCLQDNGYNELEKRLRKTLKNLTKIRKFSTTEDVTVGILCDYLKRTIEKGARSHFLFQALGDVVTQCGTLIIHCSQKLNTDNKAEKKSLKRLTEIFKESLTSYFLNRSCLLPIIFFHSVLQTDWDGIYDLVPIIIEHAFNNNVRQFRRNEALELLTGFYRSVKRLKPTSKEILSKIANIETVFDQTVREALSGDSEEFSAKKNFFVILRKLINIMNLYHESCHVNSSIDCKSLLDFISNNKKIVIVKVNNNEPKEIVQNGETGKSKKNKQKKRKRQLLNGHGEPKNKIKKQEPVDID